MKREKQTKSQAENVNGEADKPIVTQAGEKRGSATVPFTQPFRIERGTHIKRATKIMMEDIINRTGQYTSTDQRYFAQLAGVFLKSDEYINSKRVMEKVDKLLKQIDTSHKE